MAKNIDVTFKESDKFTHRKMVTLGHLLITNDYSFEHRGEGEAITVRGLSSYQLGEVVDLYEEALKSN